jgi:hypothetical protein
LDRKWTNIIIWPRDRASISVQQLRIIHNHGVHFRRNDLHAKPDLLPGIKLKTLFLFINKKISPERRSKNACKATIKYQWMYCLSHLTSKYILNNGADHVLKGNHVAF